MVMVSLGSPVAVRPPPVDVPTSRGRNDRVGPCALGPTILATRSGRNLVDEVCVRAPSSPFKPASARVAGTRFEPSLRQKVQTTE